MKILSSKQVRTRSPHLCWGCGNKLPSGSFMQSVVSVDSGNISRVYWCESCSNLMIKLDSWRTEDGLAFGELKQMKEDGLIKD